MAGEPQVERWLKELGIAESVRLLPRQPRDKMAELFRQAQVVVSPSTHDGTPNTLLEAMACGCFPVVGDIESLREWIVNGVNGLLVDPNNPEDMAKAILRAIEQSNFRARAAAQNVRLIAERAEYSQVMAQAEGFYRKLILRPQTLG
jgi:glycosyltransferase involved in cell wall biosynthesis